MLTCQLRYVWCVDEHLIIYEVGYGVPLTDWVSLADKVITKSIPVRMSRNQLHHTRLY